MKTKTGELSVKVTALRLLTKSLRPMPDKFHGVADQEMKYRQRYVDLMADESTRQRFVAMSFDFPPPEVEIGVVQQESGVSAEVAQRLVGLATSLRRLQGYDLEESVSTRLLVYAAKLMAAGMPPRMACLAALVEPLSDESDTIAALQSIVDTQFPA